MSTFDVLILGGTVFDGSGGPPAALDIGITGDRITFMGSPGRQGAAAAPAAPNTLDARGFWVSPGFIDVHSHSDFTLLADPMAAEGKLFQGVTSEINGNCGLSGGPLLAEAAAQREGDLAELGIKERWQGMDEYLRLLERRGLFMNFATLCGHGNIRASVLGYADRQPGDAEMDRMAALLAACLDAGALGLSTGLIYPPGTYSRTEELVELAGRGRRVSENFIYATHMRSEGDALMESIREAITIGRAAGRLQISHIKTAGRSNWGKIEDAIKTVEEARASGLRVFADRYPYTAAATDLDTILPAWAWEGGAGAELARLKEPQTRKKISGEIKKDPAYWGSVYVSSMPRMADKWMEGKSLEEIQSALGRPPLETLFEILIRGELRVSAIFHSMSEENLKRFYRQPWIMVGSDSSARSLNGITAAGVPHPRTFGTFPRFLKRYTMKEESLPEAIRKITSLPAGVFGFSGRGLLREGFLADIAVFDPGRLQDRATFEAPFRKAEGLVHLVVNGEAVIADGQLTGRRPGRVLRKGK
ncbi:MAG: D-aminoacylase [Nitrospiraceae bacterium]|nr:D-aminoacylase [Nitrospiraceae bacterium]